jgi:hypothetical protein
MSAPLLKYLSRRNGKASPSIAVWLALSILLHFALLLWMPRPRIQPSAEPATPPLTVTLLPQPQPEAAPPPEPPPAPPVTVAPPPKVRPPQQPPQRVTKAPPPVIALDKPKPEEPSITVPAPKIEENPAPAPPTAQATPPPAPPVAPAPAETDLTAYIEARRRARGEVPTDTTAALVERANRGALNSAALKEPVPTNFTPQKPRNGYGSFEIRRRGFDYAEFMFKGWNENFRRNGLELIEVRQGSHSSIDLAVIRSIIEIIRRTESGDFTWVSHRLGRSLTLSARARDNSGLEEFMMQEFYDDLHRYR